MLVTVGANSALSLRSPSAQVILLLDGGRLVCLRFDDRGWGGEGEGRW